MTLNFLWVPIRLSAPQLVENCLENYTHISPKWIMDVCLCLEYWLQVVMDNGQKKKLNKED